MFFVSLWFIFYHKDTREHKEIHKVKFDRIVGYTLSRWMALPPERRLGFGGIFCIKRRIGHCEIDDPLNETDNPLYTGDREGKHEKRCEDDSQSKNSGNGQDDKEVQDT